VREVRLVATVGAHHEDFTLSADELREQDALGAPGEAGSTDVGAAVRELPQIAAPLAHGEDLRPLGDTVALDRDPPFLPAKAAGARSAGPLKLTTKSLSECASAPDFCFSRKQKCGLLPKPSGCASIELEICRDRYLGRSE
jgi:hypothetical protein